MNEELKNNEIEKANTEQLEKLKNALAKLKNNESKFLFFVTDTPTPSASMYEIYFHANVIKKLGYSVKILTDDVNYAIPEYIEKELTDIPHEAMSKVKLNVGPADVLVIPEIFSNVMEQTKNLPCIRVGLLQSMDYMLNGLTPGMDWSLFGIKNIITTTKTMKKLVEEFFGKNKFKISTYNVGIPDYFENKKTPKDLVISIVGRNANEVTKIVKLFYAKYPQYSFVSFDTMLTQSKPPKPLRRKDFAERLGKNMAAVWVDRIASFGTFPIECMRVGTIPIALKPDITPEYLIDENGKYLENLGVWTDDIYTIPVLIGDVVTKFLDDSIGEVVYEKMEENSKKYLQSTSEVELTNIYKSILNEKIEILEKLLTENNKNK